LGALLSIDKVGLERYGHRFSAGVGVELREDRRDVVVDCLAGNEKTLGNVSIRATIADQRQDFQLTRRCRRSELERTY